MKALVVMHDMPIVETPGALFDVGTVALSLGAAKLIHKIGARHFRYALSQHRRGECMCGDSQHRDIIMHNIREGGPVITTYATNPSEPSSLDNILVMITGSGRDKTVCCGGHDHPVALLELYEKEGSDTRHDA